VCRSTHSRNATAGANYSSSTVEFHASQATLIIIAMATQQLSVSVPVNCQQYTV